MAAAPEGYALKKKAPPVPEGYSKKTVTPPTSGSVGAPVATATPPPVVPGSIGAPVVSPGEPSTMESILNAFTNPPEPSNAPLKGAEATWPEVIKDTILSTPGAVTDVLTELLTFPVTAAKGVLGANLAGQDVAKYASEGEGLTNEEIAALKRQGQEAPGGGFLQGASDLQDQLRRVSRGYTHQPTTRFGDIAKTLETFLIPAAAGPSKVTRAAQGGQKAINWGADVLAHGGGPFAGYEGLKTLFEGTPYEDYAAIIGAGIGGAAGGMGRSYAAPESMLKRAMRGTTQQEVEHGTQIQRNPFAIDVAPGEAIAQAARTSNHPLLKLLRIGEASDAGSHYTAPFFRDRAQQVVTAVRGLLNRGNLPQHDNPPALGAQAAEVARRTINTAQGQRSAAQEPHYTAANPTPVVEAELNNFVAGLDAEIATYNPESAIGNVLRQFRQALVSRPAQPGTPGTPADRVPIGPNGARLPPERANEAVRWETTPATQGTPGTSEQFSYDRLNLDTVKKQFREATNQGQVGEQAIDSNVQGIMGRNLDALDAILEEQGSANPSQGALDYRAGKQTHGAMTEAVVDPLQEGTVGAIMRAGSTEGAGSALFEPTAGGAGRRAQDVGLMSANDPQQVVPSLVRQHLEQALNTAGHETQGMSDEAIGAKFHRLIAGDPAAREVFEAIMRNVRPGGGAFEQWPELLDVLQATGRRLAQGSVTQPLTMQASQLRESFLGRALKAAATNGASIPRDVANFMEDVLYRANSGVLGRYSVGPIGDIISATKRGAPLIGDAMARSNLGAVANLFGRDDAQR